MGVHLVYMLLETRPCLPVLTNFNLCPSPHSGAAFGSGFGAVQPARFSFSVYAVLISPKVLEVALQDFNSCEIHQTLTLKSGREPLVALDGAWSSRSQAVKATLSLHTSSF